MARMETTTGSRMGNTRRDKWWHNVKIKYDPTVIRHLVDENSQRMEYWVNQINNQRNTHTQSMSNEKQWRVAEAHPTIARNLIVCARYLILEIYECVEMSEICKEVIIDEQVKKEIGAMESIIQKNHKVNSFATGMRMEFVAHPSLTFNQFVPRLDNINLENLVNYAQILITFNKTAYNKIIGNAEERRYNNIFKKPRNEKRLEELKSKYGSMSESTKLKEHHRSHTIMRECIQCLLILMYLLKSSVNRHDNLPDGDQESMHEILHTKYMILELASFNIQCTQLKKKIEFGSDIFINRSYYKKLRHEYSTHAILYSNYTERIIESNQGIFDTIYDDMQEAFVITKILSEFFPKYKLPCVG